MWAVISAPGNLEECHPFCASNSVAEWSGVGSQDTVEYYNGRLIERRFTTWLEGAGYDLEVSDANGRVASVSWRLAAHQGTTTLTIGLTPRFQAAFPPVIRWIADRGVVRPMLRRYLRAVLRGIEWRVTTGQPVHRNQFGTHRWFSRREGSRVG